MPAFLSAGNDTLCAALPCDTNWMTSPFLTVMLAGSKAPVAPPCVVVITTLCTVPCAGGVVAEVLAPVAVTSAVACEPSGVTSEALPSPVAALSPPPQAAANTIIPRTGSL